VKTSVVKVVISKGQNCLIYIKSGNMVRKSLIYIKSGNMVRKSGKN